MPSSAPRSISIDARTVTGAFTGIGRYTLELLRELSPLLEGWRVVIHATSEGAPLVAEATAGRARIALTHPIPAHPRSDLWLHWTLPRFLARESIAIHFSCANYLPVFKGGARHVVTIHDLISFRHPEADPWTFVTFLCAMTRLAVTQADRIIAVSSFTARELETILDVPSSRLRVVHNGLTHTFVGKRAGAPGPAGVPTAGATASSEAKEKTAPGPGASGTGTHAATDSTTAAVADPDPGAGATSAAIVGPGPVTGSSAALPAQLAGPYVLSIGARIPRKNFSRLVEAMAKVRARGQPHALVIAGPPGLADGEIHEAIQRHGMEGLAHLIDYPNDASLRRLMAATDLFVYPSIYEGFGLPILEAMASGRPAVASQTSSCPEVGGTAVMYFDPTDVEAMARAIEIGLTDTKWRAKATLEGHTRAAHFTWKAAAERTLAVLEELLQ